MRNGLNAGSLRGALFLLCLAWLLAGCDSDPSFLTTANATRSTAQIPQGGPTQITVIAIGPPDAQMAVGTYIGLTATGIARNGERQDITTRVSWVSSNPNVASFANTAGAEGVATAGNVGSTTITARLNGVSASVALTVTPATLVSLSVTPTSPTIASDTTQQFTATGEYSDRTTRDVTNLAAWSSSDPNVAQVSNRTLARGQVTASSPGLTVITATLDAITSTTTLTVTGASLRAIEVTPSAPAITKGAPIQFFATGVFSDGSTQDLTSLAAWTTTDASIATIDNTAGHRGIATGTGVGTARIIASYGGLAGATPLQVTSAALVSIGITPTNPTLARGVSSQFTATGTYSDHSTSDLTGTAIWTSSDSTVLSISNALGFEGLANATQSGAATITATVGELSASTAVTVTNAALVSIGVTPATPSIAKGLTRQFTATGVYSDLSTQDLTANVTWGSSTPTVATLSNAPASRGLLSAADVGTTTVSATLGGVTGQTVATVTSATLVSIAVTPNSGPLNLGYSRQLTATGTYTDHSTQDLTSVATWSSSVSSVASISNAPGTRGLAQSLATGTTLIRASYSGVTSNDLSLTVSAPEVVSIVVTPANPSIASGTTQQLTGSFLYSDNSTTDETANLTWSTSNPAVATVRNTAPVGRVTAVTPGTVTITASKAGVTSGTVTLTVTAATLVSIAVTPLNSTIGNGTQKQFTAIGTYTDNSTQNLTATATWSSSDIGVAQVSNSAGSRGLVTSVGVGSTFVSANVGTVTSPNATLVVSSGATYSYVLNQDADTISMYRIDTGGTLVSLGTVATGDMPASIAIDPLNRYAYVANQNDDTLSLYTIGANGVLTPNGTMSTGLTPVYCVIDASGRYVYAANFVDNTLSQFRIGAGGALTANGTVNTGTSPYSLAADPLGRHIYVADFVNETLSQFAIGTNGTLTATATVPTEVMPSALALDPAGQFIYVANFQSGTVSQFSISPTGTLGSLGAANAGYGATSLSVDPTGHHVYVANYMDSTVSEFTIGSGGALTPLDTIASGLNPYSIDVDPSGRYVYTADSSDSTITRYTINVDGSLTLAGTDSTGAYPVSVVTSN